MRTESRKSTRDTKKPSRSSAVGTSGAVGTLRRTCVFYGELWRSRTASAWKGRDRAMRKDGAFANKEQGSVSHDDWSAIATQKTRQPWSGLRDCPTVSKPSRQEGRRRQSCHDTCPQLQQPHVQRHSQKQITRCRHRHGRWRCHLCILSAAINVNDMHSPTLALLASCPSRVAV